MSKKKKNTVEENKASEIELLEEESINLLLQALEADKLLEPLDFDYSVEEVPQEQQGNGKDITAPPVFGFIGSYAYDIIIYIGRNLSLLGKKVLIVDRTPDTEVIRIIRAAKDVDIKTQAVDFCGMDVTSSDVCVGTMEDMGVPMVSFLDYDIVLIDFGTNVKGDSHLLLCDRVYCVFDMFRHTAELIRGAEIAVDKEIAFVFRDELPLLSLKGRRKCQIELSDKKPGKKGELVYHIRFSKRDAIARYMLEEEQAVSDSQISDDLYEFVDTVCRELMGDVSAKQYRKQLANAKRQKI